MLISSVLPIMTLYRLPQGQYGYSGHVVNLPQDISAFTNSLPRHPSNLDVIVVWKEGSNQSHRDFRVRRSVVLHALQWLVANNLYYRNIHIDPNVIAQLPEDGNLSGLCNVTIDISSEEDNTQDEVDPYNTHLSRYFVPVAPRTLTEIETVRHTVNEHPSPLPSQPMPWPTTGTPVSEFTTEGYTTCAFPTLFPTGSADFLAPQMNAVAIAGYFKHLMMYEGGCFSQHSRFRYFALDTEMCWRALQTGRVYIHQHPNDARLSVDELRDMVGREGGAFSNRVQHYAGSLRGTRQYWFKQRSRLISMVDTIGLPTVFSPIVLPITSGPNWPVFCHLMIPTLAPVGPKQSLTIQPLPIGSSVFVFRSSSRLSTLEYLVPRITGFALSGNIVVALMYMV